MKIKIRGIDDVVYRLQIQNADGSEFLLTDFDDFDVKVFTDDTSNFYDVEPECFDVDDNLIRIPADKLLSLHDGILRLILTTELHDEHFPDSTNTETNIIATDYFLKTIPIE